MEQIDVVLRRVSELVITRAVMPMVAYSVDCVGLMFPMYAEIKMILASEFVV
jgi:hypothetical protein